MKRKVRVYLMLVFVLATLASCATSESSVIVNFNNQSERSIDTTSIPVVEQNSFLEWIDTNEGRISILIAFVSLLATIYLGIRKKKSKPTMKS